jgi:hypothetical protein
MNYPESHSRRIKSREQIEYATRLLVRSIPETFLGVAQPNTVRHTLGRLRRALAPRASKRRRGGTGGTRELARRNSMLSLTSKRHREGCSLEDDRNEASVEIAHTTFTQKTRETRG